MSTGGSRGIRGSHEYVRKGGAAARIMLLQAAADEWKVPVAELTVADGVIKHAKSNRTTTYGKVASAAAKLPAPDPKDIKLKDPKDWKVAGKPLKRLDTVDKLTGKQVYAIDVKLPGMLDASMMDAPVFGAKVKSYDEAKAKAMPGVRHVLKVGDTAVAVVADTWWQADKALKALNIAWEEGPNDKVSSESIMAFLKEGLDTKEGVFVGNQVGDAPQAIAGAAKKLEAVFYSPYQNHVCMEPMNCTAKVTADKCEVWVATQNGDASLAAAAGASGLPPAQCEVYKYHLGGGFGRRGMQDYVTQGGADRQADPRRAGEAGLEPRGGHAPGPLPARGPVPHVGRARREGRARRPRHAHLGAVDPGQRRARASRERQGLPRLPGPQPARGPKGSWAIRSPTSSSSTPCATRTCRRASGAASTTTRTPSGSSASWTSWRRRPARTRWSSGAR